MIPTEIYNSLLFCGLPHHQVDDLLNRLNGNTKAYPGGMIIVAEEMYVREIGILLSGELCKVQYDDDGTEHMMEKLYPSYVIGIETTMSRKKTSAYSVYAATDATLFWFRSELLEQPGVLSTEERLFLYQRCTQHLASENIRKHKKIEILSSKSARQRIEKYLRYQSRRYRSSDFYIDFDRQELANYLCLNRTVLSHELKKLEKEGRIRVRKNHFTLLK